MTVVAVGKTGKGKSSTLCAILKYLKQANEDIDPDFFKSSEGPESVTDEPLSIEFTPRGFPRCRLVDTVGLFDTKLTTTKREELNLMKMSEVDEEHALVLRQFSKVMDICKEGIDAFFFVMKAKDRATEEELKTVDIIFRYLGWNMLDYVIFVFTEKDEANARSYEGWKQKIFDYLQSRGYPKERIQDRFIFVDNKNPTREQAANLLNLVCYVNDFNRGKPYTFLAYQAAQVELEKEKQRIKEQLEEKLQEKIDEKVKPIQAQHESEISGLQNMINEKEAAAAQLRADQVAERKKFDEDVAALKVAQEQERYDMEQQMKRATEQLEREKREAYERERKQMNEAMESLRQEMIRSREESARQIAAAQQAANQRRGGGCTIL